MDPRGLEGRVPHCTIFSFTVGLTLTVIDAQESNGVPSALKVLSGTLDDAFDLLQYIFQRKNDKASLAMRVLAEIAMQKIVQMDLVDKYILTSQMPRDMFNVLFEVVPPDQIQEVLLRVIRIE